MEADIGAVEAQIIVFLTETPGQVLTTLPGVAATRAAAFAVHALPIERFPTAERLYSFTGLAPARYESATIRKARASSCVGEGCGRSRLGSHSLVTPAGFATGCFKPRNPRREALRSDSARAVTAFRLCPPRAHFSLPPVRAGHPYGTKKNLPRDGA
ncbi:MAG TPA: transposase [Solirubrobacterales bacterium]|nr:transposase [Solirubrobacterales bacterium]